MCRWRRRKCGLMAKSFYIIDGHSYIYAAHYAPMRQQLTSPSGEPTKAVYIFTTMLLGLMRRQKPDMLVVTMDSKAPTFRKAIYPQYKANRPPMPDDMPGQIRRIEQILEAMNITVVRMEGFEADDVIGTLVGSGSAAEYNCFICSQDKDVLQLLDDHIWQFDIKSGRSRNAATFRQEMGITPRQFIDSLALQGDSSDNVPGVPDVGPKTALSWIQTYGSMENLYEHIDQIKGKRGVNLRKYRDTAYLSRRLVTIDCKVPLDVDYELFSIREFDEQKVAAIFKELGFSRLLKQLHLEGSAADEAAGQPVSQASGEPASAKTVDHEYQLVDRPEKFEAFLRQLRKQKVFAVDTETTSLKPMRAELVGISFCWQGGKGFYLPVKAPLGCRSLDIEDVREKVGPILADERVRKIGQNLKYDLLVLRNAGMEMKGVYFDTMVASYSLAAERRSHSMDRLALDFLNYNCIPISALIGKGRDQLRFDMVDTASACEYSAEDADITFQLYEYFSRRLENEPKLQKLFEQVEMPLVSVLAEIEYNGVSLDTKLLRRMSDELAEELDRLAEQIYEYAGGVFNIDSPKQLGEVLFDKLGLTSLRIGKTGRSTDAAVLEQLTGVHPVVELIVQYRSLGKLKNTYTDKLAVLTNPRTRRLHTSFNQTITATGRLSSSSPNLQNIPIRTELGRKIRSAFVPQDKDGCILRADYSQVELRFLAHFSKDEALTSAFAADEDIHQFVASQIYNVPLEEVTNEMRSRCKMVNFGIIYGQGAFGLSRSIGISQAEAKRFIDEYFARYRSIRKFMDEAIEQAGRTGYAETILHRRRKVPGLKSRKAGKRAQAQRLTVNSIIQGSAADLIKVAMVNIHRKIEAEDLNVKLILQIHDELVFELPTAQAEQHTEWIRKEMTGAMRLDVPLKVDISYGPTWLSGK